MFDYFYRKLQNKEYYYLPGFHAYNGRKHRGFDLMRKQKSKDFDTARARALLLLEVKGCYKHADTRGESDSIPAHFAFIFSLAPSLPFIIWYRLAN